MMVLILHTYVLPDTHKTLIYKRQWIQALWKEVDSSIRPARGARLILESGLVVEVESVETYQDRTVVDLVPCVPGSTRSAPELLRHLIRLIETAGWSPGELRSELEQFQRLIRLIETDG